MTKIGYSNPRFGESLISGLRESQHRIKNMAQSKPDQARETPSFMQHLESGIDNVNQIKKHADQKSTDLATGKEKNIHETMLAATQAELSFNLMVQIRNKALEAYQEVMRMPV